MTAVRWIALRLPWLLCAFIAASGAVNAHAFWVSTDSSNHAGAAADALQQGSTPTVAATGPGTVEVGFTRASTSAGRPITGYLVKRYESLSAPAESASFLCSWPLEASLSCFDQNVPDGTWYYTNTTTIAGSLWSGNESTMSAGVTIDNTAPDAPSTPDLAAASDSGSSNTDNLTSVTTPTFTGTAEAGSTVRIFAGGVQVGSGTATGGNYSIQVSALAEGTHTITATATDPAGNASAPSGGLSITIDTTAPAAPSTPDLAAASDTGSSNTDNLTSVTTPTFTGTAEAGSTVRIFAGGVQVGSGTATGGNYSIQVSALAEGVHSITARASDGAGNSSASSGSLQITVDVTAPLVTTTTIAKQTGYLAGSIKQSGNYYVYANITETGAGVLSGTADVTAVTSGGSTVALVAGSYSANGLPYNYRSGLLGGTSSLTSGDGTRLYSITSIDLAGNTRTQSNLSVGVDNTAPFASDIQTANGGGTAGRAEAGDTITFTFSEQIDPQSVLAGWTGTSTNVVVRLIDGGCTLNLLVKVCSNDSFDVRNASNSATLPLGSVNLNNSDYHGGGLIGTSSPLTFGATGTPSTMVQSGSVITITLGTGSGTADTGGTTTMTWSPSTVPFDAAGNNMSSASRNEQGASDREF